MKKSKVVIASKDKQFKQYIAEYEDIYFVTFNQDKAINFKWFWLFFRKKHLLEGIKKKFGGEWELIKVHS